MNIVIIAEIMSAIYMVIPLVSLVTNKNKAQSSKALELCAVLTMLWVIVDMSATLYNVITYPIIIKRILDLIAYSMGGIVFISFIRYCYFYMREKTHITFAYFYFPLTVAIINVAVAIVYYSLGKLIVFENEKAVIAGNLPILVQLMYILSIIYVPFIAFTKRKEIGYRAVSLLGVYGIAPIFAIIIQLAGGRDFTVALGAFSVIIVAVFLQNEEVKERIRKVNIELIESNNKLQANQRNLENRINIINAMNSIYFASAYINLERNTFVVLTEQEEINHSLSELNEAQEMLYKFCEQYVLPQHLEEMKEFVNLDTINERLKDSSIVSCKYIDKDNIWSRAYIIAGDRERSGEMHQAFFATRTIKDEQEKEERHIKQMEEITQIVTGAGLGMWRIILKEGCRPRMQANEKMLELLGLTGEQLSEEEIYDYWYKRIVPREITMVTENMKFLDSEGFTETTYLWRHPEKGKIFVRGGGYSVTYEDGTVVRSGYHSDVTQTVREEELQKEELAKTKRDAEIANKAKSDFLFNMSHDIRTPLNAILGYTELILGANNDYEKCIDYTKKIQSSSDFLLSLINNVLEVARIESGKVELNEEIFVVGQVSEEVAILFSEPMKKKGIEFTYESTGKTKYIYADKVKLKEIYMNLISNAYKYTLSGGRVKMSFRELPSDKPDYVKIEGVVSDTGIGMSEVFLPKLFDEFSRSENTTKSGIQGTGLGMPIVKKYVELMGGDISVQSELGKGTTFVITLEHRVAKIEEAQKEKYLESGKMEFVGKRILLAEDNELNSEIAMVILQEAGFMVELAHDGVECVDMLVKAPDYYYDLILMDIQMPNLNGYDATRKIRRLDNKAKSGITILAMTANAFDEDKRNALDAGMNGHLSKPINVKVLMDTLAKCLSGDIN